MNWEIHKLDYYYFRVLLGRKRKIFPILTICPNLWASLAHNKIIQVPLTKPCIFLIKQKLEATVVSYGGEMSTGYTNSKPTYTLPLWTHSPHCPSSSSSERNCPCDEKTIGWNAQSYINCWLFAIYHKWLPSTTWLCPCSLNRNWSDLLWHLLKITSGSSTHMVENIASGIRGLSTMSKLCTLFGLQFPHL